MKKAVTLLFIFLYSICPSQDTKGYISTNITAPAADRVTFSYELALVNERMITGFTLGARLFDNYFIGNDNDFYFQIDHCFIMGKKKIAYFLGPAIRVGTEKSYNYPYFECCIGPCLPPYPPRYRYTYNVGGYINQGVYFSISEKFLLSVNLGLGISVGYRGDIYESAIGGLNVHFKIH